MAKSATDVASPPLKRPASQSEEATDVRKPLKRPASQREETTDVAHPHLKRLASQCVEATDVENIEKATDVDNQTPPATSRYTEPDEWGVFREVDDHGNPVDLSDEDNSQASGHTEVTSWDREGRYSGKGWHRMVAGLPTDSEDDDDN